jgi:protein ImuB
MFAALYSPRADDAPVLLEAAREFSPRVERQLEGRLVLIDAAGLSSIVGDAEAIARELRRALETTRPQGAAAHVAVAPARIASMLLAIAQPHSVVLPGRTEAAVGLLSLAVFDTLAATPRPSAARLNRSPRATNGRKSKHSNASCALCFFSGASSFCAQPGGACTELPTLRRWGLRTLADLVALPPAELAARLGQVGIALQRLARGLDRQPLVPIVDAGRFEASFDLEWPVEQLEPLSFVLTRLLDPLSTALERADRGAAAIETTLTLVTVRVDEDGTKRRDRHVRRIELPAPMRDSRVLRTLILLDLESHPPPSGVDRVAVRLDPTPSRIVQFSLLERAGPQPETIATLVSRLTAVMGEGRVGSPVLLDSHAPDAFALKPFGDSATWRTGNPAPESVDREVPVLRRFRIPVIARVVLEGGRPVHVTTDRVGIRGGAVHQFAGPWRGSGGWWVQPARGERGAAEAQSGAGWDRDEFDVTLSDGGAYRICRDRQEDRWFIEGILD